MSNTVWVRWRDPSTNNDWLCDKVRGLDGGADISDLRAAFVEQQHLEISPATVQVRSTENGEMMMPSTRLKNHFVPPSDSVVTPGPGRNEDMALFLTLPQQQQQQQDELTANALGRIEKKLDDLATVDLPMSEATMNFTSSLLENMKIKYVIRAVNKEAGEGQMEKYPWGDKEHEADGQPGCKMILEGEMLPLSVDGDSMGMYDVRNCSLPELKAGKRKSNGYSNLAVGPEVSMEYAVTNAKDLLLSYTVALVELKTGRADLKLGQLLLQLVSLAFVSGVGQGVVVLGTDCVTKWRLLHFSGYNSVVVQPYTDGRKCIADFKMQIAEGTAKMQQNAAPAKMTTVFEDGADVDMADFGVEETERDKAIDREAKLRNLASVLGSLYGETPEVPSWVKASETCPSYYM